MRLTLEAAKGTFGEEKKVMRKIIKVALVLAVIFLNVIAIAPDLFNESIEPKESCVLHQPTIQITDVMPLILPSLFKVHR